jgi:hypothetical protein
MNNHARLFATDTEVICTDPLNSLEIASGNVTPYMPDSAGTRGFVYEDLYCYGSGRNEYTYIDADLVTVNIHGPVNADEIGQFCNYPNPFSSTTYIEYSLGRPTSVKIEVFDVHGRRISTLMHERKSAGTHIVEFNADHLGGGLYLYTISTADDIRVGKMLLMK